jgi:hypothetical protein
MENWPPPPPPTRTPADAMATVAKQPVARLHVGGLPRELLDDELRARFAPFGAVRSVEVLREKPESPFHRRDPVDAPDAGAKAGGRGAKAGGRGAKVGGRGAKGGGRGASPVAPPCRGFAYVELTPSDAKSLNRCVTLYNGCKWKGGVMHVQRAKPRWNDRLRMEREGAVLGPDGAEMAAAEAAAAARARRGADAGPSSAGAASEHAPNPSLPPLRRGDELEIDGRARNSKVTVTVGRGAKQHVRDFSDSDDAVAFAADWTPFDEDASWRTARRLCQLPGMRLWKPKPPARRPQRRDEDDDDVEVVGSEEEEDESSEEDASSNDDDDDGREDARFALPREFFASAAAADRAARRADGANGASDTRERFGVGPMSALSAETDDGRGKRRRGDSVEMRVLSAFLGGGDSDSDSDEEEKNAAAAKVRTPDEPPKKARKTAPSAPAAADPAEGGVPTVARATKWWETTTRPSAAAAAVADEAPSASAGAGAGGGALAKDFFAARPVAAANASKTPARDFFRAAAPAPFAPRSREEDDEEGDDASASVSASDEPGDDDDEEEEEANGEGMVSEDELLGDWQDDEEDDDDDDEEDEEDEDDSDEDGGGDVDASEYAEASSGESFSEDSGPGSEEDDEDEDESEGELGVVDFD